MRTELEQIEKIEEYLSGKMNASDKEAFEKEIDGDPKLKEDVDSQRELERGVDRVGFRENAQQAYRQYRGGSRGMNWLMGTIAIIVIAAAAMWFVNSTSDGLPELNENGEAVWVDADKYLPSQTFTINNNKDTVIETEGGIVMAIPAGCFLDEDGNPVDEFELEVKEALDASAIMQAGLTTMSGDELLESGGMFYINGRKDGKTLKIDPAKGVYVEVPTGRREAGMKMYDGVRQADGTINWVDALELDNFLVPVDIMSLDFYPPEYIKGIIKLEEASGDKEFTDSLYYSFAFQSYKHASELSDKISYPDTIVQNSRYSEALLVMELLEVGDTLVFDVYRGINPAKIKAIWAEEFNNTNLATKEFEKRMSTIHRSCNAAVLELYIDNLDKNLSEIDKMAAAITSGEVKQSFEHFASQNDGKVEDGDKYSYMLKAYYVKKQKAIEAAVRKTAMAFQKEQAELDNEAAKKQNQKNLDDINRKSENFWQEFNTNLDEAYRQLGYEKKNIPNSRVQPRATYSGRITEPGWKNVDQAVWESTFARETLDFTDKKGNRAVIKYEEFTIELPTKGYDRVYVYLLPDGLNSYMRMKGTTGVGMYSEKLNELFEYSLMCLAYKGDQAYVMSIDDVRNLPDPEFKLEEISSDDLELKLKALSNLGQSTDLQKDVQFQLFEFENEKRVTRNKERADLKQAIRPYVFPCSIANQAPAPVAPAVDSNFN